MKVKAIMKYHCTPVRMAKLKKPSTSWPGKNAEQRISNPSQK